MNEQAITVQQYEYAIQHALSHPQREVLRILYAFPESKV